MSLGSLLRTMKGLVQLSAAQTEMRDRQSTLAESVAQLEARAAERHEDLGRRTTLLSDQLNLTLHDLTLLTQRQLEFQRETRLLLDQMVRPSKAEWNLPFPPFDGPPQGVWSDRSRVCRQDDMASATYPYWMNRIGFSPLWHRKRWEFMYICQALYERGFLKPGMKGLGFGVGEEPLPAYFASEGCVLTLTDMPPEAAVASGWVETEQHAASREAVRRSFVCPDPVFDANVSFRFCDMNAIPADFSGFDFCWSACALEHLGSIEHGLAFIENSVKTLRPGGVAVHTTEFNLSSDDDTVTEGSTVLFRRRDLEALSDRLERQGHKMTPLDVDPGDGVLDRYLDVPPYRDEPHLKLALSGYAATSIGIVVERGPD